MQNKIFFFVKLLISSVQICISGLLHDIVPDDVISNSTTYSFVSQSISSYSIQRG